MERTYVTQPVAPEIQETTVMNYLSWSLFLPLQLHAYADMVTDTQGGLMRPSKSHCNNPEMWGHATLSVPQTYPSLVTLYESTKRVCWKKCFHLPGWPFSSKEAQNRYYLWMEGPCIYNYKLDFQEHFLFCTSTALCTTTKAFEGESSFEDFDFPTQTRLQEEETAWYHKKLLAWRKTKPIL